MLEERNHISVNGTEKTDAGLMPTPVAAYATEISYTGNLP